MRKVVLIIFLICLGYSLFCQVQLSQMQRADSTSQYALPFAKKYVGFDSTYMQEYGVLEFRNDSLCILGDSCFLDLSSVKGLSDITIEITNDGGSGVVLALYDEDDNLIDSEIILGVILNFSIIDSGDGAAARFITSENTYQIPFKDGTGVDVYRDGSDIKFRIDSSIVATQTDIINNTFDSTHIYQALADSVSLDLDRDPTNELDTILIQMTEPSSPKQGDIWINSVTDEVKKYDGSAYYTIGSMSIVGSDDQTLSIDSSGRIFSLSIENGNTVEFEDTYIDDDASDTNEGLLSFTDVGGGVYRIESNTAGGATPFFNDSSMPFTWTWNISGNAIGINATIDYSDIDNTPTIPTLLWQENGSDIYFNTGNVGIGLSSPSYALHVSGRLGLSGTGGVFVGNGVGNETMSGTLNLGFGDNNLLSLTTGFNNLSFGSYSMRLATIANNCVSIGNSSQYSADGSYNITLGTGAGYYLDGIGNYAVGRSALDANTSGNLNIVNGYQAFSNNTTGSNNIAIGWRAGYNNITGSSNVFLGYAAGYNETASNLFVVENSTSSTHLLNGTFQFNRIGINKTTSSLTHTLNVGGDVKIDDDLEVTGEIKVTDQIDGTAINIAGYDSDGTLVRVSVGSNVSLTSGTLSADDQVPAQSYGSARMNDITYTTGNYPSYQNIAVASSNGDGGDVTVSTGLERMEIDSDGGGVYMVHIMGTVECVSGSDENIEFYMNTSSYTFVGTVHIKDTDEQSFTTAFPVTFSNNDDIILSVKPASSPGNNVTISHIDWTIVKI